MGRRARSQKTHTIWCTAHNGVTSNAFSISNDKEVLSLKAMPDHDSTTHQYFYSVYENLASCYFRAIVNEYLLVLHCLEFIQIEWRMYNYFLILWMSEYIFRTFKVLF